MSSVLLQRNVEAFPGLNHFT